MCFRLKARSPLDLVAVTTSGWCATCWRAWGNRSLCLRYVSRVRLPAHSLSVSGQCQCPSSCSLTVCLWSVSVSIFLLAHCLSAGVLQCLSCFSSTVCLWSVSMSIFLLVSCLSLSRCEMMSVLLLIHHLSVSLPACSSTVQ